MYCRYSLRGTSNASVYNFSILFVTYILLVVGKLEGVDEASLHLLVLGEFLIEQDADDSLAIGCKLFVDDL